MALWPEVVASLVTNATSLLPEAQVFDGPPVTKAAPTAYLTVGFVLGDEGAGDFTQERDPIGPYVAESGTVRSELVVTSGGGVLATARSTAFALTDALTAWVRGDQTLGGVLPPAATAYLSVDVLSVQDPTGAAQRLVLTVSYTART